jgi:DNA repair photolyase
MGLNVSKGNMYKWVSHTWNTIKGECPHDCTYCYMKVWGEQKPIRFDEKELNTDLGHDNFIFVGSSCDMFADAIPDEWIERTIIHMAKYDNSYLLQTKNPARVYDFLPIDWDNIVVCTTIETNKHYPEMGNAPSTIQRAAAMKLIKEHGIDTMVTIEPVMDFDIDTMMAYIEAVNPFQVNIGANSRPEIKLQEPNKNKLVELITRLNKITKVELKDNLKRLLK